jgi:hypothetical protein
VTIETLRFVAVGHRELSCGRAHIHTAREEWGGTTFPLVPGHEIAGVVSEVGSRVTRYQVGDRVGVGCMVDSCRERENCKAGEEQYCLGAEVTCSRSRCRRRRTAIDARPGPGRARAPRAGRRAKQHPAPGYGVILRAAELLHEQLHVSERAARSKGSVSNTSCSARWR